MLHALLFTTQQASVILNRAVEVAQEMKDVVRAVEELAMLASVQNEVGDKQLAAETLHQAIEAVQPIEDERTQLINLYGIASVQIDVGVKQPALRTLEAAEEMTQTMEDEDNVNYIFEHVAITPAKAGEIGHALKIAQQIGDAELKASTLARIASTQIEMGDNQQGLAILRLAMETARKIIKARSKDYAGVNKQALEAAQLIGDVRTELSVLNRLALTLATESVSEFEQYQDGRRLKTAFTFPERKRARQFAEVIRENRLGIE